MKKYALLSVSDKAGIVELAQSLSQHGIQLLSTGGTFKVLEEAGLNVEAVEEYTGFPEMMDGRVKTLHPKVHGGLLHLRDKSDHLAACEKFEIAAIDYLVVNLYPFKETIHKENVILSEAIENIDIGGPSMLRSAAKNYQSVTVVTDPRDYPYLIQELDREGNTSLAFRAYLARKVFQLTAHYDAMISEYLTSAHQDLSFPEPHQWNYLTLTYDQATPLRYGENSHQAATFYRAINPPAFSLAAAQQLQGKQLSYNNLRDADAAIRIAREFDQPCAVAVKHMNPCGVALGADIEQAFANCYQADPVSIFGGILVLNRPVEADLAQKLQEIFLEIIIAPEFSSEALAILETKKNLRLLNLDFSAKSSFYQTEYTSIIGGLLGQATDASDELPDSIQSNLPTQWTVMTQRQPDLVELQAMNFAMKVCKHVKSNAIVVSNGEMTLGIGAGQMNRVGAAEIALKAASSKLSQVKQPLVLASDAFFPFADTVELALKYGVSAIIQPGGSIRDQDSVELADQHQLTMVKTGMRHFKH
ncbi:bifunctional phosphoribosylaminoimidazolecarboxamide formyltransferase/IMP cyclohydrolase [Ignavigranum ruoffiae]|uniref:Bifunctional purine biosynthesis protein PurH n=1 Tax=Ignavigranum ruoffiae TaxID=89093 RepID=A0A1H8ZRT6_9LACT|nr:bifunctional phosphoribosylaminoimidazolecarboxamide formyltransferase/IMP cyclohydrolase [Ignavigranum ruoffiae]UPQ85636.1 bifunctional phosphoribosylaminoimidazolecarboxamide formyltransferase/IMP cyclohydrolase [Ignavigranum ruoffiae]SEP67209.1 IMP cyclohydrolase /phosphoribosylaminoimidazolecarboxamide formyltransferase [Ignavigranum ruoffiae]